MKILLRIPDWLGDAVMFTPSLEALKILYPNASFGIIGSRVSVELFRQDSRIQHIEIDDSKMYKLRIKRIYDLAKQFKDYDIAINFKNSFLSNLLIFFTRAKIRISHKYKIFLTHKVEYKSNIHQVKRYFNLVCVLDSTMLPNKLSLIYHKKNLSKTIAISPGAAFGSAKRWTEIGFIEVAIELSKTHSIMLLGGKDELSGNTKIESALLNSGIKVINNTNKTSIQELANILSSVDLFITNDSGPMHIATACGTKTIAIFGPTDYKETNPWMSKTSHIIKKDIACSPCKKRVCPLKHHKCMEDISSSEVIELAKQLLNS